MTINEVKQTVEQVVRVEYIADDGAKFRDKDECAKYEESALFAVSSQLKRICTTDVWSMLEQGSDEDEVEIFDIQTDADMENLKRYLYLVMKKYGASETSINETFKRNDSVHCGFDCLTKGHEIIIFWGFDKDSYYAYRDGSLKGYLDYLYDKIRKIMDEPEQE